MSDPTRDTTTRPSTTAATTAGSGPVTVRIPGPLRDLADGSTELTVTAGTISAALDDVLARHPRLRRHLRAETGALREHVNVFRNGEDIRFLDGEATVLESGDEVTIVPSIAGG